MSQERGEKKEKINVHLAMDEFGYLHQELLNVFVLSTKIYTYIYL